MTTCDLSDKSCVPCEGGVPPIQGDDARAMMKELHADWQLNDAATEIRRRMEFKGFAKPVYHANLAAWLADREGHHPEILFGWGYLELTFTTHAIGGLSENDFICAAKWDKLLATG